MSEWISNVPFNRNDFNGTKPPAADTATGGGDGGQLPPTTNPWGSGTTTGSTPGSGGVPPIITGIDYWLRDENNEVITDQNGEPISLEGLAFYA